MHLSRIRILNYRSCKDIEFSINKYSVIVGYNNAGKSNAIYAIQWLLNPTSLGERDFYDPENDIEVYGVIEGLNEAFLSKLLQEHKDRILSYISNEKMLIKRVLDHNNMTSKKGVTLFVSKEVDKEFLEAEWTKNPTGIDNAINAIFPDSIQIPAMSDAFEDSTKFAAKTTMGQLVSKIIDGFKKKNESAINTSLKAIKELVCIDGSSRSDELEKIDSLVSKSIAEIFPGISAKLHITLPTIEDIFKGATLKTIEDGCVRDLDTLGHGTQRSIQMALIRSLAEVTNTNEETSLTMILIEEPELFLHPYAIELTRQSLKKLSKGNYQVIAVTHSPLMIANDDLPDTLMFRKSAAKGTFRLPTIREKTIQDIEDLPSQAEVLFSLSNKVNILFSEKVLLVEGRTEYRVLPRLFEKINNASLQSKGIALVPQEGVDSTVKSIRILNNLGLKAYALVDMDFAFRGAIKNNLLQADDQNIVSLKALLARLSATKGFLLDESGLPKKGNSFTSSDAFSILAQDITAKPHIEQIHSKLKAIGIWIWTQGSFEDHLGVSGKTEAVWASIVNKVETLPLETAISDLETVKQLNNWLNN